jgi:hypothetical protein
MIEVLSQTSSLLSNKSTVPVNLFLSSIKWSIKNLDSRIFFRYFWNSDENYHNKNRSLNYDVLQRPVRASACYLQSKIDLKATMPPHISAAVAYTLCSTLKEGQRSRSAGNTQLPGRAQKICQSFVGGAPCPSGRLAISIERPNQCKRLALHYCK